MSGSRKRLLPVATSLGLACVAATCFLIACGDSSDDGDKPSQAGSGAGGESGAGIGGASAGSAQAGEENVAGEGGEAGDAGSETGGTGGSTAGTGGKGGSSGASGSAGIGGSAGSGGAPVVLVPNCVRDTTSGRKIEISPTGNDGLFAAAYGPDGLLYAAGYTQPGVGALEDRSTVVVRFTAAGALDPTWGSNGVVTVNVKATATGLAGLAELPRGLAFQNDGKLIVAGSVEAYTTAQTEPALNNDRDVYVLRLTSAGTLDATFGDDASGIHFLPLNTGTLVTNATTGAVTLSGADAQWGLNVLSDNKLIVTAATRASGLQPLPSSDPRTDTDFAVVKLTADGAQDSTFGLVGGTPGVFTFDIAQANASVRTASVLSDGKLIVTGYSSYNGAQRPVIFKLNESGQSLDTSFGFQGVFNDTVGTAAEAYGALVQTDGKLVTVGYGRATAATTATDLLSIRLTASGLLDSSYGTTTGTVTTPGRAWYDVGGLADNGRAIVLSDNRPVLLGGGSLSIGQQDAVITLLTVDGKPVTSFGSPFGCTAYDFGSVGDFFWSGAVSPSDGKIAAVGLTGHGTGSIDDTDGIVLLINKP